MNFKSVDPSEARALIDGEGYVYLDVRSVPEYEGGHAPGALNIPLLHRTAFGMQPNPDFLAVVERAVPKETRLVVGCASGVRSKNASRLLTDAGYDLVEMDGGFMGKRDPMGRVVLEGWAERGFPVTTEGGDGKDYASLKGT